MIKERAPLLVYDVQSMKEKGLVSNSQSILRKLKVREVSDIEIKRKLKNIEVTQKTSACIVNNHKIGLMLLIIRNFDYFGKFYYYIYIFKNIHIIKIIIKKIFIIKLLYIFIINLI